jgi:hypothetical protein
LSSLVRYVSLSEAPETASLDHTNDLRSEHR